MKLLRAVVSDPTLADRLPFPWDVPEHGPRWEVSNLKVLAIRQREDPDALEAYLAQPPYRYQAIMTIANGGKTGKRALYAPVIAPFLRDPSEQVRIAALYFFQHHAAGDHAELARWATDLVVNLADTARPAHFRETVSTQARRTLYFTLLSTKERDAFVAAGRELHGRSDPAKRRTLAKAFREHLPEALQKP